MEEIAKAFGEYVSMLENLRWANENNLLPAGQDIGELAYSGTIAYKPAYVIAAFVAAMEIAKAERVRVTALPKRQRAVSSPDAIKAYDDARLAESEMRRRAKELSIELSKD